MRCERDNPASAPLLDRKVLITQLNAPGCVKYSANLSSAEIRVFGSGLRVAVRHCATSEVAIVNGIRLGALSKSVTCHITREDKGTRSELAGRCGEVTEALYVMSNHTISYNVQ